MNFSLRALLVLVLLASVATAVVLSRYSPINLRLGMDRSRVENLLRHAGAEDVSDGMSTYAVVVPNPGETTPDPVNGEFNSTGMWHLASINLTFETEFADGKLAEIKVWDWTGRQLDRYHHAVEFDSVSELTVPVLHGTYRYKIIETNDRGLIHQCKRWMTM